MGLPWLKLQHRIMAAHLSASAVGAQAAALFVASIGLLKTFVFFANLSQGSPRQGCKVSLWMTLQ